MHFRVNPYYSPEACGLEIFESVDTGGSYEYNMFVVWKKLDDGSLWWDTDSGCSCPTPFSNSDHGHDLKPVTLDNFNNFDSELKGHNSLDSSRYREIRNNVRKYLKEHEMYR